MQTKKILLLSFVTLTSAAIAVGILNTAQPAKPKPKPQPMLVFPKGSTYYKEWKSVDSLINLGLSKSALEKVEAIYTKAKAEKNAPQIVKAIMHRLRLVQQFQEDDVYNSIYKMN